MPQLCALDIKFITCNRPWWEYSYRDIQQILQIRPLEPREPNVKHLPASTREGAVLPENHKQCDFNHRLNQSKHGQRHSCETPVGKTDADKTTWGDNNACGGAITQGTVSAVPPRPASLWLGPHATEGTHSSELSQTPKDIWRRTGWQQPRNLCH